jgi:hypothetical protein
MKKLCWMASMLFWLSPAHAVFGPLSYIPEQPTSDDVVRLRLNVGVCDSFASVPSISPDPVIAVEGSVIRVVKAGITVDDLAQ